MAMYYFLEKEKRNINQFYLSSGHILTELHKTDAYVEQLKAIITKLNVLFTEHEKFQTKAPETKNIKEYAVLVNQIAVELNYLLATNEAMNNNIEEIYKTDVFQFSVSGKMMDLKKEINSVVKKAVKIVRS